MPNPDVTTAAAPSAATETANPYESGKLTQEISKQFLDKAQGKEPVQPQNADTASADTSKETTSAGKPESAAAPDSAKETQEKGSRRKPSAEERIAELTAKVRELEGKKQAPAAKEAESATAKPAEVKAAPVQELKAPVKPKVEDFESWEKYEEAKDKYTEDLAEFKAKKAVQDDRKAQAEAQQTKQLETELTAARERYPDFDKVVAPLWNEIATDKAIHPAVQEFVGRSPVMVDLMYAIGGDAETMTKFLAAAKSDPFQALRYAVKAEELVLVELAKSKEKTESKSEPEVKEKKDPPAKAKTEEPTPNREVGNRGTGPNDVAADAVRRNDFRSFDREQTRRAAERHRTG